MLNDTLTRWLQEPGFETTNLQSSYWFTGWPWTKHPGTFLLSCTANRWQEQHPETAACDTLFFREMDTHTTQRPLGGFKSASITRLGWWLAHCSFTLVLLLHICMVLWMQKLNKQLYFHHCWFCQCSTFGLKYVNMMPAWKRKEATTGDNQDKPQTFI